MSKAGSSSTLLYRTDVVPKVNCHDWQLMIFMQDYFKPVVELVALVLDVWGCFGCCRCQDGSDEQADAEYGWN
jgi:hypothetical protein